MSSYTPVAIDESQYLRVSATYTDSVGGTSATSEPVQVLPLPTVSLELLSSEIAESGAGNSTTVRARLSRISPAPTSVTVTRADRSGGDGERESADDHSRESDEYRLGNAHRQGQQCARAGEQGSGP